CFTLCNNRADRDREHGENSDECLKHRQGTPRRRPAIWAPAIERADDGNAENDYNEDRDFTLREAIGNPCGEWQQQKVGRVPESGWGTPPNEKDYCEERSRQEDESRFHPARTIPVRPTKIPCGKYQRRDYQNAAGIADPPGPPPSEGGIPGHNTSQI